MFTFLIQYKHVKHREMDGQTEGQTDTARQHRLHFA